MKKITLIVCLLIFLSACSDTVPKLPDVSKLIPSFSNTISYKDDVNQGSVLERFKINQLKIGMSKTQVNDLIGSPSVSDPFHHNQWDYINHSNLYNKKNIHYRLSLTFKNDILSNIDQTGITSLPALSEKEKILENKRIAEEKILQQRRIAKEKTDAKALVKAKIKRIAREKAAAKAKALEQKRLAKERSKSLALVKAKNERIAREKAAAEAKALEQERLHLWETQTNKPY